jgi:hypothetical protein
LLADRELEKLANAIEEALRTKNFVAFWNTSADSASVEAYGKKLDTFVGDLTVRDSTIACIELPHVLWQAGFLWHNWPEP